MAAIALVCASQDRERGVVWEETIIFLQDDVKMVSCRTVTRFELFCTSAIITGQMRFLLSMCERWL